MPKIVKGGPIGLFENAACCEISKTLKEKLKNLQKTNEKDFCSLIIVPKKVKGEPLGFINIHSVEKYQKKLKEDLFGARQPTGDPQYVFQVLDIGFDWTSL